MEHAVRAVLSGSVLLVAALSGCESGDKVLPTIDDTDASQDAASGTDSAVIDSGGAVPDGGNAQDASTQQDAAITHTAKDPDCDMNGVWIGRQITQSLAVFAQPQFASTWYYLELAQDGEDVVVTKHMDCGIRVLGTVEVELPRATTEALMVRNSQVGRKGKFAKQADGTCSFSMETFWSVRGANEAMFAPTPRSREISVADLQKENPLPTAGAQAEDWENDGHPGTAWNVSGIVRGTRHSAQRDWIRWLSAENYAVQAAENFANDLLVRAEFSNEETVYEALNLSGNPDFALRELSKPDATAAHTLTLRFLGRSSSDPRAVALQKPTPFDTCLAIQSALPAIKGLK